MLNDGRVLTYAFGLTVGEYRGLPMVEHTGSTGGYRAVITRFPTQHTSFVALCNVSTADPGTLMHRVADVVLASKFTKPVPAPPDRSIAARQAAEAAVVVADLPRFAGRFYSDELDATYEIGVAGRSLVAKRPRGSADTLQAVDSVTFRRGGMTIRFAPGSPAPSFSADYGRVRGIVFARR